MTERKLFGTDGVRGAAGELISAELAVALGRAATLVCDAQRPQVLIVRDTRESGPMLEAALGAGIAQGGGDSWAAGVLPTPAASVLVRRLGLDLAAVISASHNPWADNGIKFFGADGRKLGAEAEAEIEALVRGQPQGGPAVGRVGVLERARDDYLRELHVALGLDLAGRRIALDCANGATYQAGPAIFTRLGAEVDAIGTEPDGRNINDRCGSTHPGALAELVAGGEAEIGFAFDGDGDRMLAVDRSGSVRDGDELLALVAGDLRARGELGGGVAVTVMTNLGFHRAMDELGIEVAVTPVGDRHVATALEDRGWHLGGEQSGHLIWREYAPTGDGIASALLLLRSLGGADLAETRPIVRLPQRLLNVAVADRDAVESATALWEAVERENATLDGEGRVLVRASGTEPLVRVMVEAPTEADCEAIGERVAGVVKRELG